jgi:hypothetical protein
LTWPLLTLTAGILIYLLVNDHYEVQFVYEVTSRSMPTYLKITAWWGGQSGSLLFWSWLMSVFTSLVTLRKWDRDREFLPWVIVVSGITMAFFMGMNLFFENPFAQLYQTFDGINPYTFQPATAFCSLRPMGAGLNPLLRHPGMVIHPPMLYLGFVSFVIPYAFAIAALDHRPHRRPLDPPHPPLDVVGMAVPLLRTRAGRTLGLRCARLGRLLGLGPGGDRGVHALVDRHCIFALGHDPGKARHVEALEHAAHHPDL